MKKLALTCSALALAGVATVAYAKDEKAAAPKADAPKAEMKPVADKPAPAGGAPAKVMPPPADKKAPEPPPAMEPPKPSEETLKVAKMVTGTWKCEGKSFGMDGAERPSNATFKFKLDLDKMWIVGVMEEKKTKGNTSPYKFTVYRSFSDADKKWYEVSVDNMGGYSTGWSTGPDAKGQIVWETKSQMGPMAAIGKDYEDVSNPKAVHLWGDWSMDNGKTWSHGYDVTCKK